MNDNVDEKVVQMRFDNRQFETNVKQSMSTLDKLKAKLNFKDVSDDLDQLDKNVKKTDLSPLGKAAETVSLKFDALGVTATTALVNITNTAVNAGKRLVSAFTIDPIKSGFQEYETQINSVQTILANTSSKGTTLDEVNAALDELNTYADKTIYNFTEMTRNIGTFTAAGIGLKESTSAIQGIANLAAVSGSTSQQASTAMYQLSQALAAGTVKLQDWNSVVNAGMGGQVFQDALKKTAKAYGTNVDALIEKSGSFRESLKEGWITSEILTETLSKMTKSGAAEYLSKLTGISQDHIKATQELVAANEDGSKSYDELAEEMAKTGKVTKEDALEILKMADTAEDAATKVKTFTQLMDTLKEAAQSGWTQTWEIIVGDFGEAKELFTEISDFFGKIIGDASDARNTILEGAMAPAWEQIGKKIEDAGIPLENFQNKLIEVAREHGIAIDKMIEEDGSFEKTLKRGWLSGNIVSETISKFIGGINGAAESTENLANGINNLGDVVNKVIRGDFGNGADRIKALIDAGYDYATVQDLVNRTLAGETINFENLSDAQMVNLGFTDEQIQTLRQLQYEAKKTGAPIDELIANISKPSGRELLIDSFRNALKGLMSVINSVKESWTDIFPPMTSNQLYEIIENIHKLSEYLVVNEDAADKLKRTFKGLFAIIDIIRTIAGGAFSIALKMAANVLGLVDKNVLDLTASIGDAIVEFRKFLFENNKITEAMATAVKWIAESCIKVKEWIDAFLALPEVQNKITSFKAILVDTLKGIQDYFADGIEKINEFVERVKSMDSVTLDNIGSVFKDFKDNVLGYFFTFDDGFGKLRDTLSDFTSRIKSSFDSVTGILGEVKTNIFNFVDSVIDKFGGLAIGGLVTIGLGAALLAFANTISKVFSKLNSVRDGFVEVLKSISGALDSYAKDKKANIMLKFAGAVAILAGSLALISLIKSDKLWDSLKALGLLAAGMTALSAVLALLPKATTINNSSISIIAFAGAILILVNAIEKLNGIEYHDALRALDPLSIIIGELTLACVILSKFAPNLKSGSLVILSFSASVLILIEALKRLSEIEPGNIKQNVDGLIPIGIGLLAFVLLCRGMDIKESLAVVSVVASIGLLLNTFKMIEKFEINHVGSTLLKVIAILAVFTLLMKSTKNAGQYAKEGGAGVLMMSAAMIVLAQAFKTLSKIDKEMINKSLLSISTMLLIFGAITALSKFAGENAVKAGAMLLLMSGAIAILSGVMFGLSLIAKNNPDGLGKALGVILSLEAMFAVLVGISKLATDCQKTLIVLVSALGVMAVALGVLSFLDKDGLTTAAIAISSVTATFALLVGISKLAGDSVKTIGVLAIAIGLLSGALYLIAGLPVQATITSAESLSMLMIALSASLVLVGAAKEPSLAAIGALGGISLVVGLLAGVLGGLESMGLSVSIENAISLSVLAVALSGALAILSVIGPVAKYALIGAGILLLFIAAFGAALYGLGSLIDEFDLDVSKIDDVIAVCEKIGYAIGAIVGGALAGITAGIPMIADNLSLFMTNLSPFLTAVKDINGDTIAAVSTLVAAVMLLTAGEFISGIASFLGFGTSAISSLGTDLCAFGNAFLEYAAVVNGMSDKDIAAVTASAEAGKALALLLNSVPNSGGKLAELIGDNTWNTFKEGLPEFGEALVTYSETVSGLDETKIKAIEASVDASKQLCSLLEAVPNSGGMLAELVGDNTWDTFREGLPEFGEALVSFSTTVLDLDETKVQAIEKSVEASKKLCELLDAMPNSGGFAATLLGDNTWTTFMDGLVAFGGQLNMYSMIVGNCDEEAIANSTKSVRSLISLLDSMPNSGGVAAFFAGDNTWEKLGEGLVDFADILIKYADKVEDVDVDTVTNSSEAIESIITSVKSVTFRQYRSDKSTVANFKAIVKSLGECVSDYSKTVSKIDFGNVTTATSNLLNLVRIVQESSGVNSDGITALKNGIEELGTLSVDKFVNQFSNSSEKIKMAGIDLVTKFVDGLNSKQDELESELSKSVSFIIDTILDNLKASEPKVSKDFRTFGYYITLGLVNGINSSSGIVKTAISNMADNVIDSFKEKLEIHSPSAIFEAIGEFIDKGLSNGVDNGSNGVIDSVSNLGNQMVDKVKGFAGQLSDSKLDLGSILGGNANVESLLGDAFDFDLSALTSTSEYAFDTLSTESNKLLTAAKKEFDAMLENYKNGKIKQADYDKQYTALLKKYSSIQANVAKYAIEKTLPLAKKEYDALLEDYKNGKIKQAEYDAEYLNILKKYKAAEVDIYKYAQAEIEEYISKNIENLNKDFEDKVKDIQQKIDSYASKMKGSFDSMITYTTNKDVFDKKTEEYNKKLEKLNEEHEHAVSIYGEESIAAQNYQRQIDKLTESYEKYKKEYEKSDVDDDKIIGVQFTNKIKQSTKEIQEYTDAIKALTARNVNSDMIDSIASMDREKGLATVKYLNSLSDKELSTVMKNWDKYVNATTELSNTLYNDELKTATKNYVESVVTELESLPDSATTIGVNMVKGLALGFSEETENSLKTIGQSSESITKFIKAVFGIKSPSRVFKKEIGANLAKGLCGGFTDEMESLAGKMVDSVPVDFSIEPADNSGFGKIGDMISNLVEMIQNGLEVQPTIRPVLDLSSINTGARSIDALMSRNYAMEIGGVIEETRNARNDSSAVPISGSSSFTFNQYNTSPKALSRREIRNDTIQGLQLAKALR